MYEYHSGQERIVLDKRPIGIFDSGIGGLTVASEIMRLLPGEEIIYFGDTARVPYGSKSKEMVTGFSRQIVNFLIEQDVKCIVIACGTVSSNCYEELLEVVDIPLIEVVTPGVSACLAATESNVVGVIGTERTIASGSYEKHLKQARPEITVHTKACPLFVPLAEEGWIDSEVAQLTAEIYLNEFISKKVDTLLLCCTHYPLLLNCIQQAVCGVKVINPAFATAERVEDILQKNDIMREEPPGEPLFYLTDNTNKFGHMCKQVLGKVYEPIIVTI